MARKKRQSMERQEVRALHDMFDSDASAILDELNAHPDDQRIRRLFVQTTFTVIEAQLSMLRWYMLDGLDRFEPPLGDVEIATLRDQALYLSDAGVIESRPLKVGLPAVYWFTYWTLIERIPSHYQMLRREGREWQEFMLLLGIRDRATHPRHADDMIVRDDEIAMARRVYAWNEGNFGDLAFTAQSIFSQEHRASSEDHESPSY